MRIAVFAVVVALTGCAANAQVRRDRVERAQDKQELRADARQRVDDASDVRDLRKLRADFQSARSAGTPDKIASVQTAVIAEVDAELRESDRELAQKRAEVRRDHRELSSDRREVRRDVASGRPGFQTRDDVRDRNDDVRDLRDDQRDRARERVAHDKLAHIRADLVALKGKTDPQSLDRFASLMNELIEMGWRERRGDIAESREDHRELREDLRETREDRRQN